MSYTLEILKMFVKIKIKAQSLQRAWHLCILSVLCGVSLFLHEYSALLTVQ